MSYKLAKLALGGALPRPRTERSRERCVFLTGHLIALKMSFPSNLSPDDFAVLKLISDHVDKHPDQKNKALCAWRTSPWLQSLAPNSSKRTSLN